MMEQSPSARRREKVEAAAAPQYVSTEGPLDPSIHKPQVQLYIDQCPRRKRKFAADQHDARRLPLKGGEPLRGVVVAASAHALSRELLRELISEEANMYPSRHIRTATILRTIAAANAGDTGVVSELEAQWATTL